MAASIASGSRLGLLLIEDDDDDALIVEDLLAAETIDVTLRRGRTLAEGLPQLSAEIDCVLVDLRLPDAVGLEAVRRVRSAAPWIAVIVLTGLEDEAAGETAVAAGAQDYLIKGKTDARLLARAIRYAVGRRQAEEAVAQLRLAEVRADETARLERGLVPHPLIANPAVWIASRYLPGRRRALIGGDFYDAVEVGGRLHVIMGDVSGRGPDEAALGAGLRIAWRTLVLSAATGDRRLETLQTMIEAERRDPGAFATLCTLEIDPAARSLTMHRAGHPAPMLFGGGAVHSLPLERGGPPIGMFSDAEWSSSQFELPTDWAVLLYTDGVIEGRDEQGRLLGEDGLRTLLADYIGADPQWRAAPDAMLTEIAARAEGFPGEHGSDDVALLALGAR